MPIICKTDNCKKRVYKNNLCIDCYHLYLQENILEQLTILNELISSGKIQFFNNTNNNTNNDKNIKTSTFIPTIESISSTNQIKTSTTESNSNISEIIDKLKTLNITDEGE